MAKNFDSRKLRHRLIIQAPVESQNQTTGDLEVTWQDVASIWGAISPLSAREFIAAQSENNKVTARITIRHRSSLTPKMRLFHESTGVYYNIEGILADDDSGKLYMTLPVSEGVKYQDETAPS